MEIRGATVDDAEALARVHIDSWRAGYRGLVPEPYLAALDYAQRAQRYQAALAERTEETYVAVEGGEVLGLLTLVACRDADLDLQKTGEISRIYLAPRHWRKGFGRALCRYGEALLEARGYSLAMLWVFRDNEPARRFYEAMGFKADGASKTLHPGTALEAVRYRKELVSGEPAARAEGKVSRG
jgi:ribosomal protein S18 acetylase RimI-like enzyme